MYIYFDVNGNLKEIVQEPVRQGDINSNTIYAYVSPSEPIPTQDVYPLLNTYGYARINFGTLNSEDNLNPSDLGGNSPRMTKLTGDNCVQIPYDSKRDLKYFKYGYKYEMWMIELPSSVTEHDSIAVASIYLFNLGIDNQKALNKFSFNVEASVGIKLDSTMTQSQYSYLYNHIQNTVPYTGATDDLDLGEHSLSAGQVKISNSDSHEEYLEIGSGNIKIEIHSDYIVQTLSGSEYIYNFGDIGGTIATQEWVGNQSYATQSQLPSQAVCGFFYTSAFTLQSGGNYAAIDIPINNFIAGSNMLIITWDNCFALCPIPQSGPGRVVAAMWNANGEAQTIRVRYELKDDNTKLDIYLQGGFTPPASDGVLIQCIKLFS